jgi:glycosyltransferase involved in cell wall biosynthesis
VHGPEEFDRPERLSLGVKIEHSKFVAGVSSFGRSQLQRWAEYEHWRKIHVVRCAADERWLAQEPTPVPNNHRVVCVARFGEQKGHLVLIHALAKLVGAGVDIELVLVGDGPMRPQIESACERLGVAKAVHFAGWQTGEQTRQWLRDSRCLVLPSFAEGLPVVIMEAFAEARPVISTYIAGIPELIEDGRSGWLVPAGDVERLTAAMRVVLDTSPAQLEEMGRRGREKVAALHHPKKEAATLLRLFRE